MTTTSSSEEVAAALQVAILALSSIRHEVRWTTQQARMIDIAIERGSKALGKSEPVKP